MDLLVILFFLFTFHHFNVFTILISEMISVLATCNPVVCCSRGEQTFQ